MENAAYLPDEKEVEAFRHEGRRICDRLTAYKFTELWKFDIPLQSGKQVKYHFVSPVIRTRHKDDHFNYTWRLGYSGSLQEIRKPNFSVTLRSIDKRHLEVHLRCYLDDGTYSRKVGEKQFFKSNQKAPKRTEFMIPDWAILAVYKQNVTSMMGRSYRESRLESLPMIIRVEFEFFEMDFDVFGSLQLSQNLQLMLLNEEQTDVTIQVGLKAFRVHKQILVARSPVFAEMFEAPETVERIIKDVDVEVFEYLLNFIYCGQIEEAKKNDKLKELKQAAEKYGIKMNY